MKLLSLILKEGFHALWKHKNETPSNSTSTLTHFQHTVHMACLFSLHRHERAWKKTKSGFLHRSLFQCSQSSIFCKSVFSTTPLEALLLYMSSPLLCALACAVFLVSPSDCCFACSATADRYSALCVWWGRHHRWNNNRSACLYRAVSQLVQGTQEAQCKTIIYNNTAGGEHRRA